MSTFCAERCQGGIPSFDLALEVFILESSCLCIQNTLLPGEFQVNRLILIFYLNLHMSYKELVKNIINDFGGTHMLGFIGDEALHVVCHSLISLREIPDCLEHTCIRKRFQYLS